METYEITLKKALNGKKARYIRLKVNSDCRLLRFLETIYKENGVTKKTSYRRSSSKEFDKNIKTFVFEALNEINSITRKSSDNLN